jgi:hypothetical protein
LLAIHQSQNGRDLAVHGVHPRFMMSGTRSSDSRPITDASVRKLQPRIAAGLAPLIHLQLRVLEKTEFEKRLASVERLLRELIEQH